MVDRTGGFLAHRAEVAFLGQVPVQSIFGMDRLVCGGCITASILKDDLGTTRVLLQNKHSQMNGGTYNWETKKVTGKKLVTS